jgi:hypothetical protein
MRFQPIWRTPLIPVLALQLFACSEPRCPPGYTKDGDICRKCPRGMERVDGMCRPVVGDGGTEAGADAEENVDAAENDAAPNTGDSGSDNGGDADTGNGEPACVPATEICGNKIDDDCNGEVDEPSARPEECNGSDENCDGFADEELLVRQSRVDIWPQAIDRQNFSQVAMLPNGAGGGWLLYRAGFSSRVDDTARNIAIVGFNANGESAAGSSSQRAITGATQFVANGDGRWVVVASRQIPLGASANPIQDVRIQLFRAEDMDFVGERVVVSRSEIVYTTFVYPLAVSVFESEQGTVHILVAYGADDGSGSGGSLLHLQAIKRAVTGQWSATASFQLFDEPSALNVAISRVPCREEWVVATAPNAASSTPSYARLARYTPTQAVDQEIEPLRDAVAIGGLGGSGGECQTDPEVVLLYASEDGRTNIRHWNVDRVSGEFRKSDRDLSIQTKLLGASLGSWRGRWWVSGADSDGALTVSELRFGASQPTRHLRLLDVGTPNPGDISALGDSHALRTGGATALLPLDGLLFVSAGNGVASNLTELLRARQSTTDQAAAVTYRIGCP